MRKLIFIFICCFAIHSWALGPSAVEKNNHAIKNLEKENLMESFRSMAEVVSEYPYDAKLHYNLGVVLEKMGESKKASQEFIAASRLTNDKELLFQSYFNAATALGFGKTDEKEKEKNIDTAIQLYQKALEFNSESIEAKTNIELLTQIESGGGGGGGNQNQEQNKKDQKQSSQGQQEQKKDAPKPKPTPKPFQSKELSEQDAKKMLDEIKRQEESVRAKMNEKKQKERPLDKDW